MSDRTHMSHFSHLLKYAFRYLAAFILLLTSFATSRAETLNFRNYSVKEGLANSTVYSIFQDSKGFMWFATESGVNRFDGQKFELFTMDNGLSDNEVLQIKEDSSGRIWFLTLNGKLSYYFNNHFYNPDNNPVLKKSICPSSFFSFYEDSKHNLWFTTNQNRVLRIDAQDNVKFYTSTGNSLAGCYLSQTDEGKIIAMRKEYALILEGERFSLLPTEHLPLSSKSITQVPSDKSLLFLSGKGLVQYRHSQFLILSSLKGINNSVAWSLLSDSQNQLWVGTMGKGILLYRSLSFAPENHLRDISITHLFQDTQGNIWIATIGNGVYMLPFYSRYVTHFTTQDGMSSNAVTSIVKVRGQLILGLRSGNLDIVSQGKVTHKTLNNTNQYNPVKRLYYDKNRNSVWYTSDNSLIEMHPQYGNINLLKGKDKAYALKSISISKRGELAVALASGVFVADKSSSLTFNTLNNQKTQVYFPDRAFTVYYDAAGRLWFSNIQGLQYYAQGKVTKLYQSIPALKQRITDIAELTDGRLVCTTYGFGVYVLKNNQLTNTITTANGLASNICKRIFVENNKAWIVTGKGISVINFNRQPNEVDSYGTENGLISNEINDVFANQDTVYIATNNGISVFRPALRLPGKPPVVYLKNVLVDKRPVKADAYLHLSYTQNNITVNYIALDYSHPSHILYGYKLNHDSRWFETQGNTLEFGSVEPGKYLLEIRAKGLDTKWGAPVKIQFTVYPPFWKTWWFILLSGLVFATLLFFLIRYYFRTKQTEEKEKLITKTRIISLEQQALQAMMNPHFIFNVMNSIQYFINTKENTMANQVLTGFARLIRKNLDICNKSYISVEEEVSYLALYLSLEKMRFGEKMNYSIEVDKEIDNQQMFIPSMLLQPYVENAIWHGIMPKDSPGTIKISIRKRNDELNIEIADDGVGIENSKKLKTGDHISRGMRLTEQRVLLLNKFKREQIKIDVSQVPSGGTKVQICIPLKPFTN
ncbi:hypothetical protein EKH83_19725 [Arcticibacter tournemirensis]|uniref:Uncharacterized protein n=2 Tax=Arcticibacter tournemirensis TaxID=699437 RepID=A0A4Q0M390_9SPHI|nr:hypothetical protein EKH83_19725 [Arcticibacter tournemirensis]